MADIAELLAMVRQQLPVCPNCGHGRLFVNCSLTGTIEFVDGKLVKAELGDAEHVEGIYCPKCGWTDDLSKESIHDHDGELHPVLKHVRDEVIPWEAPA